MRRFRRRAKRVALRLLIRGGLPGLTRRLWRRRTTIFMLHRFAEPGSGAMGHDPTSLGRNLEFLRRKGYQLLALDDALHRHADGETLRNAVCFTVDDGYDDFATLAAPVFSAYECPATVFLTTGFLDGHTWPWWDRIEHAFRTTSLERLELESPQGPTVVSWDGEPQRRRVVERIVEHCKTVPEAEKWELIDRIADRLEVEVPARPPRAYRPLAWDQVRALGGTGLFHFGPHTVTHPILSQAPVEQVRQEILESRSRVEAETSASSAVFCYPNGDPGSFGAREMGILVECGFLGAVTSVHGYVSDRSVADPAAAYTLPRFPYSGDGPLLIETVSGMRRLRPGFRRAPPTPSEVTGSTSGWNR